MAGGNLGDLEFGLTLKSRIESEAQKVVKVLNDIDATGKKAQDAVSSITDAFNNINGQGLDKIREKLKKFTTDLNKELEKEDFDANRIKNLHKLIEAYSKIYDIRKEMGNQKIDSLHIFPNGISKEVNAARTEYNKLSSVIEEVTKKSANGLQILGIEKTSGIRQAVSELLHYKTTLDEIRKNNGIHPVTGLSAKDVFGSSEYKDSVNRAKQYAREIKEALKSEELERKRQDRIRQKAEDVSAKAAVSAEKQRQRELENTRSRILSMEKSLSNLQEKAFTAKSIGLDTREAEAKIAEMKAHLRELYDLKDKLGLKDMTSVGRLGNLGNGRETRAADELARIYDRANKEAQKGEELERKRQAAIVRSGQAVQSELVRGFERANGSAGKLSSTVQDLKSLFLQGGLVFGAQQFAMNIVTVGGEMEKQHIAMQSILGDMQNANTLFGQIKELALNSPFTFSELNRDVKQLAAYGVEYDQLYDTTKRLADMSSGLGVSFDRIALAFGQVQARGWLDGKELRQIAYAGIPLLDKLSQYYSKREGKSVSTSQIKDRISKREVSFDDVKNIFWEMTDAGGQFYNMQQTLSETLLGRYNKLKDAWEIMLADFASGNSLVGSFFKTAIEGATTLVQSLHTLALPFGTLFAGYTLKKALGGGSGNGFLSNKSSMASDIQEKLLQGHQLSQIEREILATKGQITDNDLKALASAKALTLTELNRLRIAGRITAEQYNTYRGLVLQQTGSKTLGMEYKRMLVTLRGLSLVQMKEGFQSAWTGFATSGMAAIRLVGTGIKTLGTTLWSAIGGLPGLIISGITFGITYAISEYQELSQKIKQTQDELADKNSQIQKFLSDNSVSIAITKGDDKEIDNLIEAYKEKLKDLAPYDYHNLVMTTDEMKSHKDRLLYLEKEIKLLKEANDIASNKTSNRSFYSDMSGDTEKAVEALKKRQEMAFTASRPGASEGDKQLYASEKAYGDYVDKLKDSIEKKFGDISKDEKIRQAAMQTMSALFSSLGVPEDKADLLRSSILQAFGIGDKSSWLQSQVGEKMRSVIDETFPLIGDKIRSSIPLNEAEKSKVKELMDDARKGLVKQYPELESTLQNMLAQSKFEAVIKLVVDGNQYNDMQSELVGRIPKGPINPKLLDKYRKRAKDYGKDNNWYNGRNTAKGNVDTAFNNWKSAKDSGASNTEELYQDYLDEIAINKQLLHYNYKGEGSKSNKVKKTTTSGTKKDKALKDLEKRVSLYKKLYGEIKKYKDLFGENAMGQLAKDEEFKTVFGDKKRFPITDYENYAQSIKEMLKTLPANTDERKNFVAGENVGIQSEARKQLEDNRKDELDTLGKQLDILQEQYATYKKLYELTGNKTDSMKVAFGNVVQSDSYKAMLEGKLGEAVGKSNDLLGTRYTPEDVKKMSLTETKGTFGEDTSVYDIRKRMEEETNRVKKETVDLMADLIEKNATIAQQIEDENHSYERQLELIEQMDDGPMKDRAKEGLKKSHDEKLSGLQFEQFKQETDWVTVFDDLDRVSTSTINSMIDKIDDFSKTTGLSVESVKQLRDALDKLRKENTSRNPIPGIFGGVKLGNAIGSFIKGNFAKGADGSTKVNVGKADAKRFGVNAGTYTKNQLEDLQQGAYANSREGINGLSEKFQALQNVMGPVVSLFEAMGDSDSVLSQMAGGTVGALGAASQVSGGLNSLGITGTAGVVGAGIGAGVSMVSTLIKTFGQADYSSYYKAKKEYENLVSIWDSLISKKTEYMNIHWGTEATKASEEAKSMIQAEIDIAKATAQKALDSGGSWGSSSMQYRMWQGSYKYNGQNWQDVAPEISEKYGVKFDSMSDMLDMDYETLEKIKTDYSGLWANMDDDFRSYLEKLIDYGDQMDKLAESMTEKLTGNKFETLVSSWGDAMSQMSNTSDTLVDNFEDNMKKAILNSMIEDMYGKKIKAIMAKATTYMKNGDDAVDGDGNVMSKLSVEENEDLMSDVNDVAKQIEATRDYMKKLYGWSDTSSSASKNSVKGITETQADGLLSYVNSIRADCSVIRTEQAKYLPTMSETAKAQLTQMNQIAENTLRNADAAERIDTAFSAFNDNFNKVIAGTKYLHVK